MLVPTCSYRYPAASSQLLKELDLTVLQVSSSAVKTTLSTVTLTNPNIAYQSLAEITRSPTKTEVSSSFLRSCTR
jgi:carbohydrate-binding DOMON domain-containing protein